MSQISWKATDLLHSLLTPSQPHFTEPNLNSLLLSFFLFPFPARSMENVFHDMLFLTTQFLKKEDPPRVSLSCWLTSLIILE